MVKPPEDKNGKPLSREQFHLERAIAQANSDANAMFIHAQYTDSYVEGLLYLEMVRRVCVAGKEAILNTVPDDKRDEIETSIAMFMDSGNNTIRTTYKDKLISEVPLERYSYNGN